MLKQSPRWLLPIVVIAVLFSGLMLRGPWPSEEPQYTMVAQQMVASGNYWIPQRGSEIYAEQTPVFMWLQSLAFQLSGNWNLAFLMPSLLAGLWTLFVIHQQSRRWFGKQTALWTTFTLLLTVQFTDQFKRAQLDPVVVAIMTTGAIALLRFFTEKRSASSLALGCFCAGLATAVNGAGWFVLLMLPLAWLSRRLHAAHLAPIEGEFPALKLALMGVAAFFLPLLACLVPVYAHLHAQPTPDNLTYLRSLFWQVLVLRFSDTTHAEPIWYQLKTLVLQWFPLLLVLPWALRAWWRRLSIRPDARYLMGFGWVALLVMVFSLIPEKRAADLLPALPIFALVSGAFIAVLARNSGFQSLCLLFALAISVGLLTAGGYAWFAAPEWAMRLTQRYQLADASMWLYLAIAGGMGLLTLMILQLGSRAQYGLSALLGSLAWIWILPFGVLGYPQLDGAASAQALMQSARSHAGPEAVIGLIDWKEQHYIQLTGPKIEFGFSATRQVQKAKALDWLFLDPMGHYLFVQDRAMDSEAFEDKCFDRTSAIDLGVANRRRWYLVQSRDVLLSCELKFLKRQ